jgi:hypothetical protein
VTGDALAAQVDLTVAAVARMSISWRTRLLGTE